MQLASEAPVADPSRPRVTKSKAGFTPPPGANLEGRDRDTPPPIDRMYEHFKWQFEHADTPEQVQRFCAAAEAHYLKYRLGNRKPAKESTADRDTRIIKRYEGWHSLDAAVMEGCSESHIRKLRRLSGRDPMYGARDGVEIAA